MSKAWEVDKEIYDATQPHIDDEIVWYVGDWFHEAIFIIFWLLLYLDGSRLCVKVGGSNSL